MSTADLGGQRVWVTGGHGFLGRRVVERCLDLGPEDGWAGDVLLNVNFPDRAAASVRGVRVTRQGQRAPGEALVERIDPRGEPYVWIGGLRGEEHHAAGTDLAAVAEGFVSVTPVHLDLTHHASLERLRDDLED